MATPTPQPVKTPNRQNALMVAAHQARQLEVEEQAARAKEAQENRVKVQAERRKLRLATINQREARRVAAYEAGLKAFDSQREAMVRRDKQAVEAYESKVRALDVD